MTYIAAACSLRHIDVITVDLLRLLLILLAGGVTLHDVRGGIIEPSTSEQYLKTGDKLHLVCEQRIPAGTSHREKVVWSKAYMYRGTELRYQTIDENVPYAPYAINHKNSTDSTPSSTPPRVQSIRLISELVKKDITVSDSGNYRCRLGVGGVSSTVHVTVVELTATDALAEKLYNDTELSCKVTNQDSATNYTITWYRHDKRVSELGSRFRVRQVDATTSVLRIEKVKETDVGEYFCSVGLSTGSLKQVVNLFADPHVKNFSRSHNVVAGHTLELICRAWGWRTPNITWYRDGVELNPSTDPRVSIDDVPGLPPSAKLLVEDMGRSPDDRAKYTCVATSSELYGSNTRPPTNASATILVRVKGKLAALWPLLGLGLEVIILCVIIVVYEMRRNKKQVDDDIDAAAAAAEFNECSKSKMAVADGNSHSHSTNDHTRRRKDN